MQLPIKTLKPNRLPTLGFLAPCYVHFSVLYCCLVEFLYAKGREIMFNSFAFVFLFFFSFPQKKVK